MRVSLRIVLLCFVLAGLLACQPDPSPSTSFDFITEFDPAAAELNRVTIPIQQGSRFLENGFQEQQAGPGALINSERATLRFDAPWIRTATRLDLELQAGKPCPLEVELNGRVLGTAAVEKEPSAHAFAVPHSALRKEGNRLVLHSDPAHRIRLTGMVLPPPWKTITMPHEPAMGDRRLLLLPAPPPSMIRFRLKPASASRLLFETAYAFEPGHLPQTTIVYKVRASSGFSEKTIFRQDVKLGPGARPAASFLAEVDLSEWTDQVVELTFITAQEGGGEMPLNGIVGWARPRLLPASSAENNLPSLVIWLADTLRADHLGCYGYPLDTSPCIDNFGADALRFENVLAQSSWTKASIASLFTGLFPSAHGAAGRDDRLMPGVTTLAQTLSRAGYVTAAFSANGSFHAEGWDVCRGFEEVWIYYERRDGDTTQAMLRDLESWLARHRRDDPFLLFLHTIDPHAPYAPPEELRTKFCDPDYTGPYEQRVSADIAWNPPQVTAEDLRQITALYDGEIAHNDRCFGRMTEMLREAGLYDRSLIVFLSDHGEELLDHGGWSHGHELYQEQIRIPLLLRLPGGRNAGSVVGGRVREVDLLPSLLDWLGLDGPGGQGISFAADVDAGRDPFRQEIFAEEELDQDRLYSIVSWPYKYIRRVAPEPGEALYDLEADPGEADDLMAREPQLAGPLIRRLETFLDTAEAGTRIVFTAARPSRAVGHVEAPFPITKVRTICTRKTAGITYGLSADRTTLWFSLPTGGAPVGLLFDLARPDEGAVLTIEPLPQGNFWPVYRGPAKLPAPHGPVRLVAEELVIVERSLEAMTALPDGCHVWRVPGGSDQGPAVLSPEEKANLKALGYLQ